MKVVKITASFVAACFIALFWFLLIPAITIRSIVFDFLIVVSAVDVIVFISAFIDPDGDWCIESKNGRRSFGFGFALTWSMVIAVAFVLFLIIGGLTGAVCFHAGRYQQILAVEQSTLAESVPTDTSHVALMDTDSAKMLGDREIGSLDEVSQFEVSENYVQINIGDHPQKISPLDYSDAVKWWNNRENGGVPGYVLIDPVKMSSQYVKLDQGMIYTPGACFGEDLSRHIRLAYPSVLFDDPHFEVDDDGNPYFVAPTYQYTIGLWGGRVNNGAIIIDPVTGAMQYYAVADVPTWVDYVYDADLLCAQYNYFAQLQNGWLNSWWGQRGCKKVTEDEGIDYGYVSRDGDIWIYTGVTSVKRDSSDTGFLLVNQRTGEAKYVAYGSANEWSAMSAAEGEVQEKGYDASFPSLIDMTLDDGSQKAVYVGVLKDESGIVKQYYAVDAEQYNFVSVSANCNDTLTKYVQLVSGEISADEAVSSDTAVTPSVGDDELLQNDALTITIDKIVLPGDGNIYLVSDGKVYQATFRAQFALLEVGDKLTIYTDGMYFTIAQ